MKTTIAFRNLKPSSFDSRCATFKISLPPKQISVLEVGIGTTFNNEMPPVLMDAESVPEPRRPWSFQPSREEPSMSILPGVKLEHRFAATILILTDFWSATSEICIFCANPPPGANAYRQASRGSLWHLDEIKTSPGMKL